MAGEGSEEVEAGGAFGVGAAAVGEVWGEQRVVGVEPLEAREALLEVCAGVQRAFVKDDEV